MPQPLRRSPSCPNLNHRRSDAPVGHCPVCGEMVNARFHVAGCSEESHAASRRQQNEYCVHCGLQLIKRTA
jgi:ribosomal protein L37AE/L43A